MSSGFSGGTPNGPGNPDQPQGGPQHPGQQAYRQPQYTQPLPAGQQFPEPDSPWGPPQPNFPAGAGQPAYGGQPSFGGPAGPAQPGPGQQFGAVPPAPGSPRKKKTGLVVAAVLGVLLLAAGGLTVVLLNRDGSAEPGGVAPTLVEAGGTTAETTRERSSRRTTVTTTRPRPTGTPAPTIPGYRVVTSEEVNIAYDVPASWKDASEESDKDSAAADGVKYCPGSSFRTLSFLTATAGTDTNAAATKLGKEAAKSDFQNDNPQGGTPSPFESANGKVKGSFAEFTGSWKPQEPGCTTDSFSVYVFAFRLEGNKCGALVIDADRRTAGELDIEAAKKILATLRPVS